MKLRLELIEEGGGTQSRAELVAEKVAEYGELLEQLPPVVVFYDGVKYWLGDGFHRVAGAHNRGVEEIDADVRQGTLRDAIFFSFSANAAHGIPRSNADKRRAVERMLADGEWGKWSDRKVAETCRVSPSFVAKFRSPSTVDSEPRRYVTKHGTEAVMNTAGIAAAAERRRAPRPMTTEAPPASSATPAIARDEKVAVLTRLEASIDAFHSAVKEVQHARGPQDGALIFKLEELAAWIARACRRGAA